MRDYDELAPRPDSGSRQKNREDADRDALVGRAAAAGRVDAVGPHGVLRLQRQAGNAGTSAMMEEERSPVHDVLSSGGRPLDPPVRADMEDSLGHDFSDVRVHDDAAADASARSVQATAYTVGSHMVFQRDAYDPTSDDGRHVLAHELTHVVQQRSGPVDGTDAPGGIKVSSPADRFEREASDTADRVLAGQSAGPSAGAAPGVQRQEEEEMQTYVQRQEEEEEMQTYVQRQEEEEEMQTYVQRQETPEEEEALQA